MNLATAKLKDTHLPKMFWGLGFDTFDGDVTHAKTLLAEVQRFLEKPSLICGVIFFGQPTTFKTFYGSVLFRLFLAKHGNVENLPQYIRMEDFTKLAMTSSDQYIKEANLVFLDNVFADLNKGELSSLQRILQYRTSEQLPTILAITSMAHITDPEDAKKYFAEVYTPTVVALLVRHFRMVCCNQIHGTDFSTNLMWL